MKSFFFNNSVWGTSKNPQFENIVKRINSRQVVCRKWKNWSSLIEKEKKIRNEETQGESFQQAKDSFKTQGVVE